jgi:hypothetical protein
MTKLYKIEQLFTDGWALADESIHCTGMTQEQAKQKYDDLVNEGVNPKRLRVIREQ